MNFLYPPPCDVAGCIEGDIFRKQPGGPQIDTQSERHNGIPGMELLANLRKEPHDDCFQGGLLMGS